VRDPSSPRPEPGSPDRLEPGVSVPEAPAFAAAGVAASPARTGFRDPGVLAAFILATLIWSSTWIVIVDQLGGGGAGAVAPSWSVAYRFLIAAAAMFLYARWTGLPLGIDRKGHVLALLFGLPQFFLSYNLVYAAELYVTSGLVAVVFAMMMVPNAAFARLFLAQPVGRAFVAGSALALAGIALLFLQELRVGGGGRAAALAGIALALLAMLASSVSNMIQAAGPMRGRPIATMLAWGMLYGALADALAAWLLFGPPTVESRAGYWIGLLYLGVVASALAFALYFKVLRAVGPARAAYIGVLTPILAMLISTIFEGYRWSAAAIAGGMLAVAGLAVALSARAARN
jgi:drug/metabolite transporter (DMT)-like permease